MLIVCRPLSGSHPSRDFIWKYHCDFRRFSTFKPLNDHVLVQRLEQETISKGGIIIPDTAKEKPTKARIIAVGSGKLSKDGKRFKMSVKPGDIVLFGKYSGSEVKLNGEDYMILREDDILAVVEE